jgi:hypothetical protein
MGNLNVSMSEAQMAALHEIADASYEGNTSALIRDLLAKTFVSFRHAKVAPRKKGGRPPKRTLAPYPQVEKIELVS